MAGKWYLPFKRGRMNYENVGHLPYLLQHDIGFSGAKLYRPIEVSGSHFVLKGNYGMTRKAALDWIKSQGTKQNPARRLPANRLTPVSFTVRGKRHTGKAKRVGNVVKVFVTPGVARKINPEAAYGNHQYRAGALRQAEQLRTEGYKTRVKKAVYGNYIVYAEKKKTKRK